MSTNLGLMSYFSFKSVFSSFWEKPPDKLAEALKLSGLFKPGSRDQGKCALDREESSEFVISL